ncbi:MAG: DMT family transporter [Sphingomonadales bacterium]|jgi:drug/metabolite transporter (DMT)-like permease
MPTFALYVLTVLIWGSTWLAIRFQIGEVPLAWSVSYRFILAGLCFGLIAFMGRKSLKLPLKGHFICAGMGLFMYCANYILVYHGSLYLVTGVVALVFSVIPLGNALWGRLVLATPISANVMGGALMGLAGISVIFWPQLASFDLESAALLGLGLTLMSVVLASTGNMLAAVRQREGFPLVESNFWGMLYGGGFTAIYALLSGDMPQFDLSFPYASSLIYLSLMGSFAAFWAYITLIERIGLAQAGYALVVTPIVALGLSTLFEGFLWTPLAVFGVGLCLAGNVLMVKR